MRDGSCFSRFNQSSSSAFNIWCGLQLYETNHPRPSVPQVPVQRRPGLLLGLALLLLHAHVHLLHLVLHAIHSIAAHLLLEMQGTEEGVCERERERGGGSPIYNVNDDGNGHDA